ncbi:hypothetical protein [Janthinobacterium agaricidamnosum]|uniref:hypothetical protein n=1 Tax=Janthinobacterium agaricidamnosum TaxID=55508 RepID=UPI0013CEC350|nr:hypothetical protein [Janthinobacterium agaricidamnosum]
MHLQETKHYQITRNGKASTKSSSHNKKATQITGKIWPRFARPNKGRRMHQQRADFAPVCSSQETPPYRATARWRPCEQTVLPPVTPQKKVRINEAVNDVEVK